MNDVVAAYEIHLPFFQKLHQFLLVSLVEGSSVMAQSPDVVNLVVSQSHLGIHESKLGNIPCFRLLEKHVEYRHRLKLR